MTDDLEAATAADAAPRYLAPDDVGLVTPRDYVHREPFTFKSGQSIPGFTLRYETYGQLNTTRDNAVLICHALSGDHHCAGWHSPADKKPGWWNNLIGPGKAVDTRRFFVVCANVLGGCQGSTGPSSTNPETGRAYGTDVSLRHDPRHGARAKAPARSPRRHAELHGVIGGSMGGMTALLTAIEYPKFTRRVLAMATTGREGAQAIAFNEVGRQAIMQDPAWNRGDYPRDAGPRTGLAIARMMAHITYVSDASMDRKFGRKKKETAAGDAYTFEQQFEVEGYLRHQGQSFINRFDANTYLYITRALDQFDLAHALRLAGEGLRARRGRHPRHGLHERLALPARAEPRARARAPARPASARATPSSAPISGTIRFSSRARNSTPSSAPSSSAASTTARITRSEQSRSPRNTPTSRNEQNRLTRFFFRVFRVFRGLKKDFPMSAPHGETHRRYADHRGLGGAQHPRARSRLRLGRAA